MRLEEIKQWTIDKDTRDVAATITAALHKVGMTYGEHVRGVTAWKAQDDDKVMRYRVLLTLGPRATSDQTPDEFVLLARRLANRLEASRYVRDASVNGPDAAGISSVTVRLNADVQVHGQNLLDDMDDLDFLHRNTKKGAA